MILFLPYFTVNNKYIEEKYVFCLESSYKQLIVSVSPNHLYTFQPVDFIHNVYFTLLHFVKLGFPVTASLLENNPLSEQGHVAVVKPSALLGKFKNQERNKTDHMAHHAMIRWLITHVSEAGRGCGLKVTESSSRSLNEPAVLGTKGGLVSLASGRESGHFSPTKQRRQKTQTTCFSWILQAAQKVSRRDCSESWAQNPALVQK